MPHDSGLLSIKRPAEVYPDLGACFAFAVSTTSKSAGKPENGQLPEGFSRNHVVCSARTWPREGLDGAWQEIAAKRGVGL